jgi:hypothetical protein
MASRWRKWNTAIHRDLGYLCAGLTLVYAISGVAVNHRADWNPSYSFQRETVSLDGLDLSNPGAPDFAARLLDHLDLDERVRGTFRPDPATFQVFLEESTVSVDLERAEASFEAVRGRPVLRQANFLHLNEGKKLWTWMADLYALALATLAVTGLFVLRGRNGITGRGAWLTVAGVAIPLVFLLVYL